MSPHTAYVEPSSRLEPGGEVRVDAEEAATCVRFGRARENGSS